MEKSESPPLDNNNNQRHSKADDSESTHDSTVGDDITAAVILNVNSKLAASDNDGDLSSLNPVSHESCVNITTTSKANMSDSSSSCNNNNMNNTKQHIQQQQHSTSSIGSKIHFSLFFKKEIQKWIVVFFIVHFNIVQGWFIYRTETNRQIS